MLKIFHLLKNAKKIKVIFFEAFSAFYKNACSQNERVLAQKHADRYLIHNPKQDTLSSQELDEVSDIDYAREVHPYYAKMGKVKAQETIKCSIATHRGCFGGCNFCSIAVHQGKEVVSRSGESTLKEAKKVTQLKDFKGYITALGGTTANMFEAKCCINKMLANATLNAACFRKLAKTLYLGMKLKSKF
ncbi:MAG: hypothetical protein LBL16_00065 [Endomicrobium sp.]|jgi:radical SAM superfamily enzyme YgiQ (UPF0313 family)|nr:hypothetical protein [Endomicrobium sp.]